MYNKFEQEKIVNKDRQVEIDHILKVKKNQLRENSARINYFSVLVRKLNMILFKVKLQRKSC